MKKFTVISLLLVLVAGFAFAAGLVPYCESTLGVYTSSKYDEELELKGLYFDGDFVYGAKSADGKVDISLDLDANYVDRLLVKDGKYANKEELVQFEFIPTVALAYDSENLDGSVSAKFNFITKCTENNREFDLFGTPDRSLDLAAAVKYARPLKNSENIVVLNAAENVNFNDGKTTSVTSAGLSYYIPVEGQTDALASSFKYQFKANANASVTVPFVDGFLTDTDMKYTAGASLEYNKTFADAATLKLNGNVNYAKKLDVVDDAVTATGAVTATYKKSVTTGSNALDKLSLTATAGLGVDFQTEPKTPVLSAGVTVGVPHIIPVELIDNMSINLPATFGLNYEYDKGDEATPHYVELVAKLHPFYAEFDKSKTVFDQTIDSLDTTFAVTTSCYLNSDFRKVKDADYGTTVAAGLALELSKATFTVSASKAFAPVEGEGETEMVGKPTVVTMSYVKNY